MKKKVLIVDDDAISREIALIDLKDTYDCEIAIDAIDAYKKIWRAMNERVPYEIVVIDEQMPDMTGIALMKIIRINEDNYKYIGIEPLKFIIVSGLEDIQALQKIYKIVLDEKCSYIKKPIGKGVLLEMSHHMVSNMCIK